MSNAVHGTLQDVGCFGSACTPVGSGRYFVGENAYNLAVYCFDPVRAAEQV